MKNEYLKNLDALIVQLQANKTINSHLSRELEAYLTSWLRRHEEVETLLNSAEDRLSPRTYFEKDPLNRCSLEAKSWLAPLVHVLWLVPSGISERVDEAREVLAKADYYHTGLQSELSGSQELVLILKLLEAFTDCVGNFSRLLSSFPDKVVSV
ncbi:hypothetical protein [Pelodictyon phaeoclathratiforme]|uniref:hypothetical protein n=1 Tax=Pelodictyon phaeoclathratiforme TaxID=34090 RepID=UPI00167F94F6|nr:hypothetical protein [Pelodictyon phaeoclathratiforme]